jgi:hypothetical protein
MKLLVAVPTTDFVHVEFMKCLVDLSIKLQKDGVDFQVKPLGGTLVYVARARLAHYAMNEGFTHVLWLDSDMTFGPDIVDDLLFCGKDMVCGAFVMRRPQWGPCVYTSINEDGSLEKVREFGTEPFRVAGCGFATVLTKVDLLKAVYNVFGTTFKPMDHLAEDLAFCWRVNEIGGEIWCEPTVRPGHIAHIPVYAGDDLFGGLFQ